MQPPLIWWRRGVAPSDLRRDRDAERRQLERDRSRRVVTVGWVVPDELVVSMVGGHLRTRAEVKAMREAKLRAELPERAAPRSCGVHALWNRHDGYAIQLPCRSWACPRCRIKLGRQWMGRLAHHVFRPAVMVTVTIDPATAPPEARDTKTAGALKWFSERMRRLWQLVRRWCLKRSETFRYWRVLELQQNGRLHAHALVEGGPPGGGARDRHRRKWKAWDVPRYSWAADWWRRAGRQVGFGITEGQTVVGPAEVSQAYCAKYLSKSRGELHRLRCRLAQGSLGLRRIERQGPKLPWQLVKGRRYLGKTQPAVEAIFSGCRLSANEWGASIADRSAWSLPWRLDPWRWAIERRTLEDGDGGVDAIEGVVCVRSP